MDNTKTLKSQSLAISFVATNPKVSRELTTNKKWTAWNSTLDKKSEKYYRSIYYGNFYHQAFVAKGRDTAFRRLVYHELPSGKTLKLDGMDLILNRMEAFTEPTGFNLLTVHLAITDVTPMDELIGLMLKMRNPGLKYQFEEEQIDIHDLFSQIGAISSNMELPSHLYTFQNLEYVTHESTETLKDDCYHIANFIPTAEHSRFQNTQRYIQKQHNEFGIRIYQNWYALSLNDSFVRLSLPASDPFNRWAADFFTIYLYNVCLKNYLSYVNSQLAHVTGLSSKMEKKKNDFIEFLNDTQYHRISSKFLPNELFETIGHSLGIKEEMQILEKKIERMNNYFQAKRTRAFNTALIIITFLSVFTVIYDISSWFEDLGVEHSVVYPTLSLITAGVIILFIISFFIFRLRR